MVIRSMQPAFMKAGFIKTDEAPYLITFSDPRKRIQLTVTDRHHPTLVALFANRKGAYHRLSSLMEKLSSPENRKQEFEAGNELRKKYGLWKSDTPVALKAEGNRALLLLNLQHTITFLQTHTKILSELKPDPEAAGGDAMTPKASEKVSREQALFRPLWISRHER